jgi:hypothetical protein
LRQDKWAFKEHTVSCERQGLLEVIIAIVVYRCYSRFPLTFHFV